MSPWVTVALAAWAAYFAVLGWYLKKAFPDGRLELQFLRWKKTFRWGSYKNREIS